MRKEDYDFFEKLVGGNFDVGFGKQYNIFSCEEAIKIAKSLKNKDAIVDFHKMSSDEQLKLVPDLSGEHSGNTFDMACRLAISYLPMLRDEKIDTIINANNR